MSDLPPNLLLYQMGTGHYVSRALDLAAKLGVADLLAQGPRSADELAGATETQAPALRRVLRLLASVGVLREEPDGCFGLEPPGELLRSDRPDSMRAAVMLFAGVGIQDSWRELEYCVRTGQPAFRKDRPEGDAFDPMSEDPEQGAIFDEAMAAFTAQTAQVLAALYDFSGFSRLVDVGGGNGALLAGILHANPDLRGTVFDLPAVVERARAKLTAEGLEARCDVTAGSFFEALPEGADAYLLKHVIHDWDDEKAGAILGVCRKAMAADAKLLLVEGIYPERIEASLEGRGAAANDVNMLVCTGGRQRSEAEFRELFEGAGFRLERIVPTPARVAVLEAVPA